MTQLDTSAAVTSAEQRLTDLGITLPPPPENVRHVCGSGAECIPKC